MASVQPPGAGAAETQSPPRWTVDRIIERALESTPDLKALDEDVVRAENAANQAGKWDNPEVSVGGGPKAISLLRGSTFDVSIKQSIPVFGQKSVETSIGHQERLILETDRGLRDLAIRHEVARLAYRFAAVIEQGKHIIGHRRDKLRLVAQYLTSRPFASPSQAVEKSLIQNRLRDIEQKFLEISAMEETTWQALNVFLGLPEPVSPEVRWITAPSALDRDGLWASVEKQNLDLLRQNRVIEAADLALDKAAKKGFPDIRVGAGYSEENVELRERGYTGFIELSLPIFDRGGYAADAARAQKSAETHRLEQKRREIQAEFSSAWAELTEARERVNLFPISLVSKLEAEMTKAEGNWKKGLVPVTAFLELEEQVHDQALDAFDAQTAYVDALSRLQFLAGIPFTAEAN